MSEAPDDTDLPDANESPGEGETAAVAIEADSTSPGSFATRRPVAVLMVFLATVVFGLLSYGRLPITLMPEMTYPTITIRTEYPGAAPEEVENDISRPIEEQLGVIGGLRRHSSISRADVSDVVLEFSWDTDISDATQDALERLDQVFLPDGAERPLILHYDPSLDPVLELSLSGRGERFAGEDGLRRLRRLADLQVKRALEPISGVAAVRVRGGLEEEIHVLLDDEEMARTGLSPQLVINRLAQENINLAGGTIKEGRTEYMVRTLNEFQNLEQIRETVVTRADNREVRIRDLATVSWGHKEREILTRTDGGESVQIDIFKEADANIVALANSVRERLGEFDPDKDEEPEVAVIGTGSRGGRGDRGGQGRGAEVERGALKKELYRNESVLLDIVADRSLFIDSSISEVRGTAIFGGLLAIVVLALFLRNAWSTFIVGISIPISLLMTFGPLNLLGVTLNIMSLGGLALGIGMLVDSSIVVLESIFRCREEGDGVVAAAVRGTNEVRGAVVASTLTSIAVFFPMVFVEGIAGEAFGDLGMAVVVSLLASLAVAVFFIPMLASREVRVGDSNNKRRSGLVSLRQFNEDRRALGPWAKRGGTLSRLVRPLLLLPAWIVILIRLVLAFLIEIVSLILLSLFGIGSLIVKRGIWPILSRLTGWLLFIPIKLTDAVLDVLKRMYPPMLRWGLAHTGVMALLMLMVFATTWYMGRDLASELLPEVHQGELTFEVALPVGTPIEETDRILKPVEQAILEDREYIQAVIMTVGFDAANSRRADEGEHSARFKILLERPELTVGDKLAGLFGQGDSMAAREEAVISRLRKKLASVPDLDARVARPVLFSSRTPIEVEVHGDELESLKRYGEAVREVMADMPELADVELSLKSGAPEVQIVYDRDRLSRYNLNLRQTAELVRDQVQGIEATRFNMKDRRVPVIVRLAEDERESVEDIAALGVNPGGERPIPLSAVADVRLAEGPSEVRRIDSRRIALVNANLGDAPLGAAVAAIRTRVRDEVEWPPTMAFFITGQNEEWERSKGSLFLALGLSIFLVYVIMAAQFESLLQPLVIMLTIPLAFFGTITALTYLGISLSVVVFLGMIMLAGIVVNNAIVLVDYINTLRRRGLDRDEAIVAAGSARLRPILMTTATTVLGLLPMALGLGDGAEIRTPMAIAVISGLIASTALTLLIVPAVYAMFDRLQARMLGRDQYADATNTLTGGSLPTIETVTS